MCVLFLFFAPYGKIDKHFNLMSIFSRLSLYGRLVRAQRLSGCWDSAGQLMSNRYVGRVTIFDLIFFFNLSYLKNWTNSLSSIFNRHLHPLALIKSPPSPHLQSQVLSRIYPTNIITGYSCFFFPLLLMGHQGHILPPIACHVMLPSIITLSSLFVLLSSYNRKTIAKEESIILRNTFCVRIV